MRRKPFYQEWDNEAPTDVDKWLSLYAEDDNVFWATEKGHIQNVVDELIDRLAAARGEDTK